MNLRSLLLVAAACPQTPADPGAPGRTELAQDPAHVPFEIASGWPVVEVRIGDSGPHRMLVDTGAMGLVLYGGIADELGLEVVGETRIGDPTNTAAHRVDLVRVPSLALGDAYFEEIEAVAWRQAPPRPGNVRGIVGLPVLACCTFTLDYPRRELRLTAAALEAGSARPVLALTRDPDGAITIPIEVAGRAYGAHLDTGNSGSLILPGRLQGEITLVEGTQREGLGRRASGDVRFVVGTLQGDVRLGTATFTRPEVRFDPGLPVLNVGFGLLQEFVVTIDQRNARIALEHGHASLAQEGHGAQPVAQPVVVPAHAAKRRLGVEMLRDGDPTLRVRTVQPDSLGARAGLRAGDVLRAVEGEPIDHERTAALVRALDTGAEFELTLEREGVALRLRIPGETPPSPVAPDERLAGLLGSFTVEARLERGAGAEPERFGGEARFERTHGGRFVRETFALEHGGRSFEGEAYFAWRAALGRYELTQIDGANPCTPWLTGQWLEAEGVLRFETVPEARTRPDSAQRWEYSFTPGGGFVKRLLVAQGAGPFELRSEYRYRRRG